MLLPPGASLLALAAVAPASAYVAEVRFHAALAASIEYRKLSANLANAEPANSRQLLQMPSPLLPWPNLPQRSPTEASTDSSPPRASSCQIVVT
ncbi:hypothetical protein GQ53DRAFT_265171 [Thozetella sp. PMI_491]|nr:hypothetical protein GQ53DRAFT_265171 [Thozetella sp. PMI_491]